MFYEQILSCVVQQYARVLHASIQSHSDIVHVISLRNIISPPLTKVPALHDGDFLQLVCLFVVCEIYEVTRYMVCTWQQVGAYRIDSDTLVITACMILSEANYVVPPHALGHTSQCIWHKCTLCSFVLYLKKFIKY